MTASPAPTPATPAGSSSLMGMSTDAPEIVEDEAALLLDTSGSMTEHVAPHTHLTKIDFARQGLKLAIVKLTELDSQAKDEGHNAASGQEDEEEGGVWTIGFSGGTAHEFKDVNTDNFDQKLGSFVPDGSTYIMPAVRSEIAKYQKEFGHAAIKPKLKLAVISDGELSDEKDSDAFYQFLQGAKSDVTVEVAVIGSDAESQAAADDWSNIAKVHSNVTVKSFQGVSDPQVLADWLVAQFE